MQLGQGAAVQRRGRVRRGQGRGLVGEQPGRLQVGPRVGQHGRHRAVAGQRAPELLSPAGVADRLLQRPLHQPHRRARHRDPEHGQGGQHVPEGGAGLAQPGRCGQHDAVEGQVAQHVGGDDLRRGRGGEPVGVGGDQHQRVAVALLDHGGVEGGEPAVGDERLGTVDHQLAAPLGHGGGDALEVGARHRLGQRQRGERLAARHPGQPPGPLLVGAGPGDGVAADSLQREQGVEVGGGFHQRLPGQADRQRVDSLEPAAVGGGNHQLPQRAGPQRLDHRRMRRRALVGLRRHRLDRLGQRSGLAHHRPMALRQVGQVIGHR